MPPGVSTPAFAQDATDAGAPISKARQAAEDAWSQLTAQPAFDTARAESFLASHAQANAGWAARAVHEASVAAAQEEAARRAAYPRIGTIRTIGGPSFVRPEMLSAGLTFDSMLSYLRSIDNSDRTIARIDAEMLGLAKTASMLNRAPSYGGPASLPPGGAVPPGPGGFSGVPLSPMLTPAAPIAVGTPLGGGGGGRGRGGGGDGGGGGVGGGGGGGMFVPFAGRFGFGGTSRLLTGAVGAEIAAKALEEIVLAPQVIGSLESGALSSAQPYIDLTMGAYGYGRAGGFSGERALRGVFPGGYQVPDWMSALGLGPTESMGLLRRFGVAPRSEEDFTGLQRSLGTLRLLPGTVGVEGETLGSMRQAARYGLVQPTESSTRNYGMQLSEVLENAVARGMDRATILHSIDASIAMAARVGGIGVSAPGLQDFMFRFANLPGGRTGEAGLQAMAGLEASTQKIGRVPLQTMMAVQAASGIKSEADLSRLLGPDAFAKATSTPEGRAAVENLMQSNRRGDSYAAARWLGVLMEGNPQAQYGVFSQSQFFRGLPSEMVPLAMSAATGMPPMQVLAAQQNPKGLITRHGTVSTGIDDDLFRYDSSKGMDFYKSGLLRMGVRRDLVNQVITQAAMHKLNPLLLGGVMMQESSGGINPAVLPGGSMAGNVMQITPDPKLPAPPMDETASIAAGAAHLESDIRKSDGSFSGVLRGYNGPGMKMGYARNVMTYMELGGQGDNIPTDMLSTSASIQQAMMAASATSFHEMNTIVPTVNGGLKDLTAAAHEAAKAIRDMVRAKDRLDPMTRMYLYGTNPF